MSQVTSHPNFAAWTLSARREILSAVARSWKSGSPLNIAIYCTSGRHRSVALASLLTSIMRREAGAVSTEHLCKFCWTGCQGDNIPGNECPTCCGHSTTRNEAMEAALATWNGAKPPRARSHKPWGDYRSAVRKDQDAQGPVSYTHLRAHET